MIRGTMTRKEWQAQHERDNLQAIQDRLAELKAANPGATIVAPGYMQGIDGKAYWNDSFIIVR